MPLGSGHGEPEKSKSSYRSAAPSGFGWYLHRSRYKTSLRRSMPPAPECLPGNRAFQVLDLLLCVFLAIPAICRDPHAEHPFRRQNSLSEQLHICADNLRRFTGKGHNGGRFRQIDRHRVLVKMECCSFTGINIQTESAVCPEERSRAICFSPWKQNFSST